MNINISDRAHGTYGIMSLYSPITLTNPDIRVAQESCDLANELPSLAFRQKSTLCQGGDRCQCLDNDSLLDIWRGLTNKQSRSLLLGI